MTFFYRSILLFFCTCLMGLFDLKAFKLYELIFPNVIWEVVFVNWCSWFNSYHCIYSRGKTFMLCTYKGSDDSRSHVVTSWGCDRSTLILALGKGSYWIKLGESCRPSLFLPPFLIIVCDLCGFTSKCAVINIDRNVRSFIWGFKDNGRGLHLINWEKVMA